MSYLAFDIETIPNNRAKEFIDNVKRFSAPSNYKDEEKKQAYISNKKQNYFNKAGLFWWTGQVICICVKDVFHNRSKSFYGSDEKKLLSEFFHFLSTEGKQYKLVGKNSDMFDKPFLVGRAMYHDIGIPNHLRGYTASIDDVDKIFAFSKHCPQISSLNCYAWGLGIETKPFAGSEVLSLYQDGREEDIVSYCKHDTEIVAEIIRRYEKYFDLKEEL